MQVTKEMIIEYMRERKTQQSTSNLLAHFKIDDDSVLYKEMAAIVREMSEEGAIKRVPGLRKSYYVVAADKKTVAPVMRNFSELKRDPWAHMRTCIAARNPEKGMV